LPAGRIYTGRGFVFLARLVVKRNPREAQAILRRGLAHMEEWHRETPGNKGLLRELEQGQFQQILTLRVLGERDQITARLRELARQEINNPGLCNEVAWSLATNPDPQRREPDRAVVLARKATDQAPKVAAGWNTLGVALYRTGAWAEAIKALTRSMELTRGDSPHDWLFLAMAHWQKGDRAEARVWYDKAVAWIDRKRPDDEELTRFRAEADALIRPRDADNAMPSGMDAFVR
jgi:predicted Zn-dependent protease